ncbi:MAG: tetratricopeptide repeat protein [Planctomycetota bacterium]
MDRWTRAGMRLVAVIALVLGVSVASAADKHEPTMYREVRLKLSDWEARTLQQADASFAKGDFKGAWAKYERFVKENPRSKGVSYALLRKGRCLQLSGRLNLAIEQYQEVIDFFPNDIRYAAAAYYYKGACQRADQEVGKAMNTWAELTKYPPYKREPLAAGAINTLAEWLLKEKPDRVTEAIEHFRDVAVEFRPTERDDPHGNKGESQRAMKYVVDHYIRRAPDEGQLRKFYHEMRGCYRYHGSDFPQEPKDLLDDRQYWHWVMRMVDGYRRHGDLNAAKRKEVFGYWAQQADGRFGDWDEYQMTKADWYLVADGDTTAWMRRLDEQFDAHQKQGDWQRILTWISHYAEADQVEKVKEYYGKLDFAKMENGTIIQLLRVMADRLEDRTLAGNVFSKIRIDELDDRALGELASYLWKREMPDRAKRLCQAFENENAGKFMLLGFLQRGENETDIQEALDLADELMGVEEYSSSAAFIKGDILFEQKDYKKAIPAYQLSEDFPRNAYQVAECYMRLGRLDSAIEELNVIEGLVEKPNDKAASVWQAAKYYGQAKKAKQQVSAMRKLTRTYKGTGYDSKAHVWLEDHNLKAGGGRVADD